MAKNIFRSFDYNIGIMKISLQNINYKNHNLLKQNKQEASGFNVSKKSTSSLDTLSNYNKANIHFKRIEKSFYTHQKDFIKRMEEERDENGSLVYYYDYLKNNIIKSLSPNNIEWAEELCFGKDENNEYICKNKESIPLLLSLTTKCNIDIAKQLYSSLAKQDIYLSLFNFILENTNKENLPFVKRLYTTKEGEEFLPHAYNIRYLIQSTNAENINLVEKLCFDKDENGNYLFPNKEEIENLIKFLDVGDMELAEKLCFLKDENGKLFFECSELPNALYLLRYPDTAKFIERLVFEKDENDNYLFPQRELIPEILKQLTWPNTALTQKLCLGKDEQGNDVFPNKSIIPSIIDYKNHDKVELFEKICFLKDENGNNIIQDENIYSNISIKKKGINGRLIGNEFSDDVLAKFFKEVNGFDSVEIIQKQNDSGYEIIGTKVVGERPVKQTKTGLLICEINDIKDIGKKPKYTIKKVISNDKGEQLKTTTFFEDGKITSWIENGKKSVYMNAPKVLYSSKNIKEVDHTIEIINNKNNEPDHILVIRKSNILSGLFETTKYKLSDYPQDLDVLGLIKENEFEETIKKLKLPKGEKIAFIQKKKDGTITYKQTYTHNGFTTNRVYSKKTDEAGNTLSYKYKYEITNKDGEKILKNNRSWKKNEDNSTTTIVNGKKYTTYFDDEYQLIRMKEGNGKDQGIYLSKKCLEVTRQMFYDFVKTLPADIILSLSECSKIMVSLLPEEPSWINSDHELLTKLSQPTVAHEMGHLKQNIFNAKNREKFSHNKELLNIYNEEMEAFRKENPPAPASIIKYFSPLSSGTASTGLGEILAEVNAIMTSGEEVENELQLRMEYLIRYFPQTVAKCADLLGLNAIEK